MEAEDEPEQMETDQVDEDTLELEVEFKMVCGSTHRKEHKEKLAAQTESPAGSQRRRKIDGESRVFR